MAGLANRDIAGLTWTHYPLHGWASVEELRPAADRAAGTQVPADDPDENSLHILLRAVRAAAQRGVDIVTTYG